MEFRSVPSSPLTKSVTTANAVSLLRLVAGAFRARSILKGYRPDVVLGTGGYTTAAVLIAARTLGRRIVIHEQNAVPGRTNLWLARIADRVCVNIDSSAAFFPPDKVVATGMPIRAEFASLPDKATARRELGLAEDAFTLFVIGGSQGARRINEAVVGGLPALCADGAQVLHQVGKRNVQDVVARLGLIYGSDIDELPYYMRDYVDTVLAMAAADLVVSRCGASTLAEIAAAGLPSILAPYPYAYANHQKRNAEYLVSHGASVMCEDEALDSRTLVGIVSDLRSSPDKMESMAAAAASLARPDAAKRVAEVVISLVK